MITEAVEDLRSEIGAKAACRALGRPRSTHYRYLREPQSRDGRRHDGGHQPRALEAKERQEVLDILHGERFIDSAPGEVYATLLDEGVYLCSERTMYRILAGAGEVGERRRQRTHPARKKPELIACAPNRVWSWDITKLLGPRTWSYFYLYVILDIFSRYVVGWMLAERESADLAKRLVTQTVGNQDADTATLTIHSDNGSSMGSKTYAQLLADLGATKSHSRPHMPNDNPYSESQFKTAKYRPDYPDRFGSIEDAHGWCRSFFYWYNEIHRHSGIAMMKPADIHFGRSEVIRGKRADVLAQAHVRNPERFVSGMPTPTPLPRAVWINPPGELPLVRREVTAESSSISAEIVSHRG